MSKRVKQLVTDVLAEEFKSVTSAAVVDFTGVNALENNRLRGELKSKGVRVRTVKNSLARRAFEPIGLSALGACLTGPCALAYGGESIVDCMRALDAECKLVPALTIKAVYLDGEILEGAAAEQVAKWPNRVEILGEIVGKAMGPGGRLAGQIGAPASNILGAIRSLEDKLADAAEAETPAEAPTEGEDKASEAS